MKDAVIVFLLSAFDIVMDFFTFGKWTLIQGNVVPDVTVKE